MTQKFQHTPHPQRRSVLYELEAESPELFSKVAASKFRHPEDVSIASSLHHYYSYMRGSAVPSRLRYTYINLAQPDAGLRLAALLRSRDRDAFCLNDTDTPPSEHERGARTLAHFFTTYFPLRSSFERPSDAD